MKPLSSYKPLKSADCNPQEEQYFKVFCEIHDMVKKQHCVVVGQVTRRRFLL